MFKFIGPSYNLLQHFTDHCLRLDTLDFWPHRTNPLHLETESLTVIRISLESDLMENFSVAQQRLPLLHIVSGIT
jgi:hypothetical protein